MDDTRWTLLAKLAAGAAAFWLLRQLARTAWLIRRYGWGPWLRSACSVDPQNGRLLGILFLLLSAVIAMRRWHGVDGRWFSLW